MFKVGAMCVGIGVTCDWPRIYHDVVVAVLGRCSGGHTRGRHGVQRSMQGECQWCKGEGQASMLISLTSEC